MLIKLLILILSFIINDNKYYNNNIKKQCYYKPFNLNISKADILKREYLNDLLFSISIDKINIHNKPIYNFDSTENNINKNITILKESDLDNTIILAAHSGIGPIAYFKNLNMLEIDDEITINKNNISYLYKVIEKYEIKKEKIVNSNKYDNQLILTTCAKDNKQLIINAIRKK